mmetsp:Transcript_50003/g.150424  ORF Transcript_50003/g.150424 Transcript_50003/m.150424 type:complete len:294 (+) Transcript_50003:171-1052(+)
MSFSTNTRYTSRGSSEWHHAQLSLFDEEGGLGGDNDGASPRMGRNPSSPYSQHNSVATVALSGSQEFCPHSPDGSTRAPRLNSDKELSYPYRSLQWKKAAGIALLLAIAAVWLNASVFSNPVRKYRFWVTENEQIFSFATHHSKTSGQVDHLPHHPKHAIFIGLSASILGQPFRAVRDKRIELYSAEYTDVTQSYPDADSLDPPTSETMERRTFPEHEFDEDCIPMANWQTTFHPTCNMFHERDLSTSMLETLSLISNKGHWRSAWELKDWAKNDWKGKIADHELSVVMKMLK